MTRKAKVPIAIPSGVEVKIDENRVLVKGPKGQLEQELMSCINLNLQDNQLLIGLDEADKGKKNFQGLYHTLISNMVEGVVKGFEKHLEMIGVGYRALVQGNKLSLQIGLSHPCDLEIPQGIEVKVEKNVKIMICGADKQKIGQFAATIRSKRPPEPYQGKGIRYAGEYVRRKAGKAAAKK